MSIFTQRETILSPFPPRAGDGGFASSMEDPIQVLCNITE
jgi:hypothetical protein